MNNAGIIKNIDRIIITGDILRLTNNKPGGQDNNIKWFYYLFKFFLEKTAPDLKVNLLLASTDNSTFNVKTFYQLNDLNFSTKSWARLYDMASVNEKAEEYFLNCFKNSFVVGYELPKIFKSLMEKLEIDFIDFKIHPCRFSDDIFFGILSNNQSINKILKKHSLSENHLFAMAGIHKAAISRLEQLNIEKDFCLIVGQTPVDQSLIENGKVLNLSDFTKELKSIKDNNPNLYFKPHPYAAKDIKLNDMLSQLDAKVINDNIYQILCHENIKSIYSISSSVIEEAKYFGINTISFKKDISHEHFPVYNNYFDAKFWIDILGCVCETDKSVSHKIPDKPNRLRDNLGIYWGYNISTFKNMQSTISIDDRKTISEMYSFLNNSKLMIVYNKLKQLKEKIWPCS